MAFHQNSAVIFACVLIAYALVTLFIMPRPHLIWRGNLIYQDNISKPQPNKSMMNFRDVKPLLTLFTTAVDKKWKRYIYNNTFINWSLYQNQVTPVFFYSSFDVLYNMSDSCGWKMLKVPMSNKWGVPILRTMFLEAQKHFDSHFYAYANADILFDESLLETLAAVIAAKPTAPHILITGRRTNVYTTKMITSFKEVTHLLAGKEPFISDAQDYFISTRDGYDWRTIPDFVVGRLGYDNWLVAHAIRAKMAVIDATDTLGALHQTGAGGNAEGWNAPDEERYYNYKQAGKFDYSLGHTTCTEFYTLRDKHGNISIRLRP